MRRRFTVLEYHAMGRAHILPEDASVELLNGDIIQHSTTSSWHAANVTRLTYKFLIPFQDRIIVSVRNPVRLDQYNELNPDLKLLKRREDDHTGGHPGPEDVLLLIEVADTTVEYDRGDKLSAYARAGISEVWIVVRKERRIEAYTEPSGGGYANVRRVGRGQSIAPKAFPDVVLEVDKVITE